MSGRRARYGKIERLTVRLLESAGIVAPHVDIRLLVAREGIDVRFGELGDISGLLLRDGGSTTIGVNSGQAMVRQRFTMAHEYGHYFLHDGLRAHSDENFRLNFRNDMSATASDVDEIEANFFAACVLMPRRFLDQVGAAECIDDDNGVRKLAKLFRVSQHAMSLRLANLYPDHAPF